MPRLRAVIDATAIEVRTEALAAEVSEVVKGAFRDGGIAALESLRETLREGVEPGVAAMTIDQFESLLERALDVVRTVTL